MTEFGGTELIHLVQERVDKLALANKVMDFDLRKRRSIARINGSPEWLYFMKRG